MAKKPRKGKINYNANPGNNPRYQVDVYRTASTLLPDLKAMRKSLAKVANNRMRELEAENLDFYAYDMAADYLRTQGKKGKLRFSESLEAKGVADIRREITVLQGFLSSPSSTVAGQRKIEQKRIETFGNWKPAHQKKNANYKGVDLSQQAQTKTFYAFLNSNAFKDLRKFYSSEQIFRAYKNGNVDGSKAQKRIQQAMTEYVKTTRKPSVQGLYESVGAKAIPNSANR